MSAFNGAGTFVISGVGLPFVTATTISSTVANQLNNDLAAGLTNCITKDGQSTPIANIPLGGFKLTNVGPPTAPGDALVFGSPATVSDLTVTGNATVAGNVTITGALNAPGVSGANKLINGDFRINQRYGTAIITPPSATPVTDRWAGIMSVGGKMNFQSFNVGGATTGQKLTTFMQVSTAAVYVPAAGEVFSIRQVIEGSNCTDLLWGAALAKPITLSFMMYTNLAGLYTGVIRNPASTRTYVWSYNNTTPNVWAQVAITIPGDTVGAWPLDSGAGIFLEIVLAAGSGVVQPPGAWYGAGWYGGTGQVNLLGSASAVSFTAVKIEVGATATPFVPDDYQVSLVKCQRYFARLAIQGGSRFGIGVVSTPTSGGRMRLPLPVQMRSFPTISMPPWGVALAGQFVYMNFAEGAPVSAAANTVAGWIDLNGFTVDFNGGAGATAGQVGIAYAAAGCAFNCDAEL